MNLWRKQMCAKRYNIISIGTRAMHHAKRENVWQQIYLKKLMREDLNNFLEIVIWKFKTKIKIWRMLVDQNEK